MKYLELTKSQRNKVDEQLPEAGGRNRELWFNRYRVFIWGNEEVLGIDDGDGCTTLQM